MTVPSPPALAAPPDAEAKDREKKAVEALLARPPVVSRGGVQVAPAAGSRGRSAQSAKGAQLAYKTTCQFIPVVADKLGPEHGEPQAAVFTIAYEQEGKTAAERPVCFAFNGGPGSASVWLHLGALGPKRIVVPDDTSAPSGPHAVSDNPLTWLAHFDLVFIDPPHTGWSRCSSDEARKKMLSVDGDVDALVEVMRGWLARNRRFGSKVYLAGESYGTTRGAAMADKLLDANIALSGLILVSCAMDIQTLDFSHKNLLGYSLYLPGFANVAQYHGMLKGTLGKSSQAAREAAEAFVQDDFLKALHAGSTLSTKEFARVAQRLSELTGLERSFIEASNLRVDDVSFFFELLRGRGQQVGRLDARATAPLAAKRGRAFEFDPGIDVIASPYAMAAMAYLRDGLGLDDTQRYELLNHDVNKQWKWTRGEDTGNSYCSTSDDLARAMRRHAPLKVLVASGRYDLGTPYSASDWSLAQMDMPRELFARIEHHHYDAGHMMYTRQADLEKLARDLGAWVATT
jgi:carboxypeptidase C (cathepsin A)